MIQLQLFGASPQPPSDQATRSTTPAPTQPNTAVPAPAQSPQPQRDRQAQSTSKAVATIAARSATTAPETAPSAADDNPLRRCRSCSASIRIPGLDHSLCRANCGWVVDLICLRQRAQGGK